MRNNIDTVISDLQNADMQISQLKKRKEKLEQELSVLLQADIEDQLKHSDCQTGTATVETQNHKVKAVVPKKVKWDQDKLLELHDRILAHGDDPRAYMQFQFKVSETSFKNWPVEIQDAFIDCRTVEKGKVSFKFEEK